MRTVSETSGTTLNTPTVELYGSQKKKRKKRGSEKICEEIIVENVPNMGKEIVNKVQGESRSKKNYNHAACGTKKHS